MDEAFYSPAETSRRENILGVPVDFVHYDEVLHRMMQWKKSSQREYITLCNPHSVCVARKKTEMMSALQGAALNLPDGVGLVLSANILGVPHQGRVSGPTLMLRVCGAVTHPPLRHFFVGGKPGVADALANKLRQTNPQILVVGTDSPSFHDRSEDEINRVLAKINTAQPDVVWVGLGSPKQEMWMARYRSHLHAPVLVGVGAAFDFHAGTIPWAPAWTRKAGLEWAYRLLHEPRRLWRRNLDSPLFLIKILLRRIS
jgi:N-acetylglucosaminyldiphosphoundecaprenol N-acetyl-beta-D-mannosaminyltransferase